jgi:hypothetical protein
VRKPRRDTPPGRGRAHRCADAPTGATSAHAATIRTACATLELLPPDVLPAASVTGRLAGGAAEARLLAGLSREVAERAGLIADVLVEGDLFHVRLRRAASPAPEPEPGRVGWLRGLLRRRGR